MSIRSFFLYTALLGALCACKQQRQQQAAEVRSLPMMPLTLDDLNEFREPATQWRIAGNVYADRRKPQHLEAAEGKGVLVFQPPQADLLTRMEHADMDISLDFMLSAGSSAGIWLQGRYRIQLQDSWMKDSLSGADCGAIAGRAPLLNACKAPGLWQHLEVKFKAPHFDSSGKKISDAVLGPVTLNGTLVQQEVTLSAPDQGAIAAQEQAAGPLVLRGQQGPVAFRNIRYKTYEEERAQLTDMRYRVYKGVYKNHDTLQGLAPVKTGSTDSLTFLVGDKRAHLLVEGKLLLPAEGHYVFELRGGGPARLKIDGKEVVNNGGTRDYQRRFYGLAHLQQGDHRFELSHANYDECLVLRYEGPHIPFTTLTTPASERRVPPIEPLEYPVNGAPVMQRGFMEHEGAVDPYNMAVGIPGGLNYAYNLLNYNISAAWRGRFIDVSEMWRERGEKQLEVPLGAPLQLQGIPAIAKTASPWPDSLRADSSAYTNRGYKLLPNGLPVFFYTLDQMAVEDYIHPRDDRQGLVREVTVTFSQPGAKGWWLLASSKGLIELLPDGSYAVNDKRYYIETTTKPEIQQSNGQYQLLLPLLPAGGNTVKINYAIIW